MTDPEKEIKFRRSLALIKPVLDHLLEEHTKMERWHLMSHLVAGYMLDSWGLLPPRNLTAVTKNFGYAVKSVLKSADKQIRERAAS